MSKMTFPPVVFLVTVMAIGAAAQIAPAGASNKCDALKKAMDVAEAKSIAADSALLKAMDVFVARLEEQRNADGGYAEALKAEALAKGAWKAAVEKERACLVKFSEARCKSEIQATQNASGKLDLASRQADKWPGRLITAQKNVDDAKKGLSAARDVAQAALEAYDKAEAAHNQCAGGKVTA